MSRASRVILGVLCRLFSISILKEKKFELQLQYINQLLTVKATFKKKQLTLIGRDETSPTAE
jgi:hypothetical protein